jgi:cytochrome c oxidase subunit 2
MEIHRFEKTWLAVSVLLIVGLVSTVVYGAAVEGVRMVNDGGGQVDQEAIQSGAFNETSFESPGVRRVGQNEYAVYVVARQFLFDPGTNEEIRVPAGANVTLYVTSADVVHGFEVVGTNLNTMVIPGQVAKLRTRFDRPQKYGIVCNEYCGPAHHTMAGTIRAVPPSQFNESRLEGT